MRKMLDKTAQGEIWMEVMANLTTYHVKGEDGSYLVTTKPSEARRFWEKVKAAQGVRKNRGYGSGN